MKTKDKRNKVYRSIKTGRYSSKGLNYQEKESLRLEREYLGRRIGSKHIDDYIIPLYCSESNQVYFVNESSYSNDERAIIITY